MTIDEMMKEVHATAVAHGWWEGPEFNVPEKLALIHSEVSEALEHYRNGQTGIFFGPDGKPDGFPIELADAVIRIMDLCGKMGIDLAGAISLKHEFNKERPYRHGGKAC